MRPRQNGRHFADDIFVCIFLNENVWIPIKFSMKFVLKGPINNIPALVQIMAWRRPGDKPLSEPMMVSWTTHICVTRPQWVNVHTGLYWWHITWMCQNQGILGLYSLSGKTSYRQISWSLEAARLSVIMIVSHWNLTGISAALLPRCLSNFRAIEKV